MNNKKQSSILWLYNKMYEHRGIITIEEFEQAKKMHKEEIIDAFGIGCHHESKKFVGYQDVAEQYYKETFEE